MGLFAAVGALVGAVSFGGAYLFGSTLLASMFIGASIGSLFDAKEISFDNNNSPTYSFGPIRNTKTQILPIPIVYGRCRVAGNIFYENYLDSQKTKVERMVGISEGPVQSITSVKADDQDPTTLDGCAVYTYTNTDANTTTPLDPEGARPYPDDLAMVAVKLKAQEKLSGPATITAIVEGRQVWTPSGVQYSRNPAWIVYDLLTNTRYGLGIPTTRIDLDSFIEAADYCDALVDGGPRFTLDYVVDTERPAHDVLKDMLACFRGYLKRRDKISLHIDKPVAAPYKSIGLDNIVKGTFSWWQVPRDEVYNQVAIEWVDPNNHWEQVTTLFEDTEDIQRRGVVGRSYKLLGITNDNQVARMGAYLLDSAKYVRNYCSFNLALKDADIDVGDVIAITHDLPGWTDKWFRVVNVTDASTGDRGQITVVCAEYRSEIYNDRAETMPTHIDTSLPDPSECPDVTNLSAQEFIQVQPDGTVLSNIDVTWTDPNVPLSGVEVAILEEGEATWDVVALVPKGTEGYVIRNIKPNQAISVRVRAINEKGIKATGVTTGLVLYGKAAPPGDPSALTIASGPGLARLSWTNPSDPDFSHVDIVEYKGTAQPSSPDEGTLVASISGTELTRGGLDEEQTYWYWIRAVDTSGNASNWVGPVSIVTESFGVGPGEITETEIADNAITTPKLAANAVTAEKINVSSLSAITADLGTLTAGVAKSTDGKFYIDLTNKYLAVYDENGTLRVKLGYLGA